MDSSKFTITDDLLASKTQRFLNFIIDLFIVYIIWNFVGTIVVIIGDLLNNSVFSNWPKTSSTIEKLLFACLIAFFYYALTEMYFSRTFAKYFTKTIVVDKEGSKPNFRTIISRTLCRFIPLEGLTFLGSNFRGLHDLFSNTYVVKKHEFNRKKGVVLFP